VSAAGIEDLLRRLAPQVLGAVVRRYGHFDTCEDAVQEALLAAALQWKSAGVPEDPRAWLITVASRRLTDLLRNEQARQRREETVASRVPPEQWLAPAADRPPSDTDDTLILLFLCCHPSLPPAAQIALTLRAVGGLNTAEIARAFLVPEGTMTRRITRAKQAIRDSGLPFRMPAPGPDRVARLAAVLHVLYLIFNEGYASTSGPHLQRTELSAEAIRLTRMLHRLLPQETEVTGLLALMLLTDARRPARTGPDGALIPMAEQDRTRWLASAIDEGVAPAAGGHRRDPRRGTERGGDRLAADRRAVRTAAEDLGQPGGGAQPRGRGGDGVRPARGARPARQVGRGRAHRRGPPAARGTGAPAGAGRRRHGRPALVPGGRVPLHEPAAAAVPQRPGRPPGRRLLTRLRHGVCSWTSRLWNSGPFVHSAAICLANSPVSGRRLFSIAASYDGNSTMVMN
jgi:RNA polymerase sigma factor (sigma-70 family)